MKAFAFRVPTAAPYYLDQPIATPLQTLLGSMAAQMHLQCPTRTTRDSVVPRCVVGRRACSRHTAHNSRHFGTACVASRHIHHGTRSVTVTSSTMGSAATTPPASDSLPFETEFVLPAGRVVMRIMEPEDEKGAAVVLTRSFATQPGGLPIQDVSYVMGVLVVVG